MNEDSIEQIVTQRLDSLFGEDDGDGEGGAQGKEGERAWRLVPVREAAEALREGIQPRGVERLASEIQTLRGAREQDPLYRPLLRMIGMLADYLGAALQSADPEALDTVDSIIDCMSYLESGSGARDVDKRRRVHREIEAFKSFRAKIQAGRRSAPSRPKPEPHPTPARGPSPRPERPTATAESEPKPESKPEPRSEAGVEPTPEPAPEVRAEPQAEPKPQPEATVEPPPEAEPEAEAKAEPDLEAEATAESGPRPAPPTASAPETAPVEEGPVPVQPADPPADLGPLQRSVAALEERTEQILTSLQDQAAERRKLEDSLAGMGSRLSAMDSLPAAIQAVQKALDGLSAPQPAAADQEPFRKAVASLEAGTEQVLKAFQDQAEVNREVKDALGGMESRLSAMASLPAALQAIHKTLKGLSSPPPQPAREEAQEFVQGAMDEIRRGLDEVRNVPAGLQDMRRSVDEALSRLEERLQTLRGEIDTVRADVGALRSELEATERPAEPAETPESGPEEPAEDGEGYEEAEEASGGEEARPEPGTEPESPEEPSTEVPTGAPEDAPGAATWTYFGFQSGGRKYAVDEKYVVKASKSPGGLLKKARDRGGLTLADSAPGLFSSRKGLEPAWSDLTSAEWKRTLFQLVPDWTLEGHDETAGEGVLFLAAGDERRVLFTDLPPERITLGHEDEVQMAGGGSESGAVRGSILRAGDSSDFYLILAPERL
jgi:hypothetical protein